MRGGAWPSTWLLCGACSSTRAARCMPPVSVHSSNLLHMQRVVATGDAHPSWVRALRCTIPLLYPTSTSAQPQQFIALHAVAAFCCSTCTGRAGAGRGWSDWCTWFRYIRLYICVACPPQCTVQLRSSTREHPLYSDRWRPVKVAVALQASAAEWAHSITTAQLPHAPVAVPTQPVTTVLHSNVCGTVKADAAALLTITRQAGPAAPADAGRCGASWWWQQQLWLQGWLQHAARRRAMNRRLRCVIRGSSRLGHRHL